MSHPHRHARANCLASRSLRAGPRLARLAGAGVAVLLIGAAGCPRSAERSREPSSIAPALDVVELSASEAASRLASGAVSSRELTQAYLDRIAAIDDAGPRLDAVIELNPDALAEADARDRERRGGRSRGPLHGLPILLKDNIDAVGMVNSAGSLALADHRPTRDAFVTARLRAAGAVILGKTNLSEWANFRSTASSSGWSSRGGQTKNPYALDRNPCGSSSGTAVAVAASLAAAGVGTETDGSIICPAAVSGLVGLKPTVGLVGRTGIIPISSSQDTAGPMGRNVADVALLLGGMVGVDGDDAASRAAAGRAPADYRAFLRGDALAGKRLGLLTQASGFHPEVDAATERAVATIEAAGAEVIDLELATYGEWDEPELEVLLYEFKAGLDAYLAQTSAGPRSLAELIAWNRAHADAVMPFFGQELLEQAQAKGPLSDAAYLQAHEAAARLAGEEGLLAALDEHRLDAVIAPSTAPAWPIDHVLGDHFVGSGYGVAAVAGTPSVTVPSGEVQGLPIGLVFMGGPFDEGELLGLAFAFEQATKARRPPTYRPRVPP